MKNTLILFSFIIIAVFNSSCGDGKDWPQPNIEMVPVYAISGITGSGAPAEIDLYKTVNLVIVFENANTLKSYNARNYADTSDETTYQVSVTAVKLVKQSDGTMGEVTIAYVLSADKATGAGTLLVTTTDAAGGTSEKTFSVSSIVETEKYN